MRSPPDGTELWVTDSPGRAVSVVDTAQRDVVVRTALVRLAAPRRFPGRPGGVADNSGGHRCCSAASTAKSSVRSRWRTCTTGWPWRRPMPWHPSHGDGTAARRRGGRLLRAGDEQVIAEHLQRTLLTEWPTRDEDCGYAASLHAAHRGQPTVFSAGNMSAFSPTTLRGHTERCVDVDLSLRWQQSPPPRRARVRHRSRGRGVGPASFDASFRFDAAGDQAIAVSRSPPAVLPRVRSGRGGGLVT